MTLFDTEVADKQVILGTPPSKSNSYRIISIRIKGSDKSHGSLTKTKQLREYEKSFVLQCNRYRNKNIDKPFAFEIDVFYPNRRSDLDGCFKVTLDCLQQVNAISNDNLCMKIIAAKHLDPLNPRIEFTIKPL